jgi:hypothetical protein
MVVGDILAQGSIIGADGTNRTTSHVRLESAIGGKADYMCSERVFRLLTLTPKLSDSVCEITIRAGQTDPGLFRD